MSYVFSKFCLRGGGFAWNHMDYVILIFKVLRKAEEGFVGRHLDYVILIFKVLHEGGEASLGIIWIMSF